MLVTGKPLYSAGITTSVKRNVVVMDIEFPKTKEAYKFFDYCNAIVLVCDGSDTSEAPTRAINPQLKRNINGSNTLTFSLYSKYYDENQEQFVENPFLKYLANERKVKLKYTKKGKEEWLDFVIKNISENSETYLYTYTATDQFVNELSKTGFNLVFDEKTNNPVVLCLGGFDSIHLGHKKLITKANELKKELNAESAVFTYDNDIKSFGSNKSKI